MKAKQKKPSNWEKSLAQHISDKDLISKVYRKLTKLNRNDKTSKCHKYWKQELGGEQNLSGFSASKCKLVQSYWKGCENSFRNLKNKWKFHLIQ